MFDILYINYNSSEIILNSIKSLYRFNDNQEFNIYVWDNNSKDDVKKIKTLFPNIKLYISSVNIGFSRGINRLLQYGASPYCIIINPDTIVTEGFLRKSIEFLNQYPDVGLFGPKVMDFDGTVQGSARKFPTPLTSFFGRNSPLTKLFPNNPITAKNILTLNIDFTQAFEVDWVSGACMIVRREVMRLVHGFDERFFLYWEDTDLCRRIKEAGWKVMYNPAIDIIHYVGKSSGTRPVFATYQFHKSCYLLYSKYVKGPLSLLSCIAGVALMLRFLTAIIFNHANKIIDRKGILPPRRSRIVGGENNSIRILRIISRMNIGGPSIHVNNLTRKLSTERYTTRLITGSISPDEGDMGYLASFNGNIRKFIPELQREISPFRDFIALIKVIKEIICFNPHVIHSHTSKAGTISRIAAFFCNVFRKDKIITIHTFHGNVLDGYFSRLKSTLILWIERLMARLTDAIVAISETQKWELSKVYKIEHPNKIFTIKLGFDLEPFRSAHQWKGMVHTKYGIPDDELLIGIVGRMAPIKNHKMFFDAGKSFAEHQNKRVVKFLVVGDGEERQFLEGYIDHLGIKDKVVFTGWEKDLPRIYADLDILALTSLNEGTPVSVIEAMAAGVPVISTGVGGIKDLLGKIQVEQPTHHAFKICERGILCPKDDPNTFSNALIYMFESGYLEDKNRFRAASDYVIRNYSIERLVGDIESLYENLMPAKQALLKPCTKIEPIS